MRYIVSLKAPADYRHSPTSAINDGRLNPSITVENHTIFTKPNRIKLEHPITDHCHRIKVRHLAVHRRNPLISPE